MSTIHQAPTGALPTSSKSFSDDPLPSVKLVAEGGTRGWRRRWTIVCLCFVAFMLCNMDRVNMSIAM